MDDNEIPTVRMPSGEEVPALGQGTWNMGEDPALRDQEIATLRTGIERGLTLIDTAEMYGDGRTESLVGEALNGRRDQAFLVSKVYPHNASRRSMRKACTDSLRRLKTDRIDLYLLHWAGSVPMAETIDAFSRLQDDGLIRSWGVSNIDTAGLEALWGQAGAAAVQTDQVLYNLTRRGVEWDLMPWLQAHGVPLMAYSPIEQGRLLRHRGLIELARRRGVTTAQLALAWLLSRDGVIAIPKTSSPTRLHENIDAVVHPLDAETLTQLDRLFPPPTRATPLAML